MKREFTVWSVPWWLPPVALISLASWLGTAMVTAKPQPTVGDEQATIEQPAPITSSTITNQPSVTLVAGGDVMLSRYVGDQIRRHGPNWPFDNIRDIINGADIAFTNLEAPFAQAGPVTPIKDTLVFKAEPGAASGLAWAGFDVLSLANNHIMNQGKSGLADTITILDALRIGHPGAGTDEPAAHAPALVTRNGLRFAFLAYAYPQDATVATAERAGIATMDSAKLVSDIFSAKALADVIIVSMHAGTEYSAAVTETQRQFAHAAIDAGAALVIGSHPHVVQPIELYHGGVIAYSLGNLVFDQPWSEATQRGLLLRYTFTAARLASVELLPMRIVDAGQPTPAGLADQQIIFEQTRVPSGMIAME